VRLTCTGTLYMCLGQEDAADLRAPLRASEGDELLHAAIDEAIARKPKGHDFVIDRRHSRPPSPPHERHRRLKFLPTPQSNRRGIFAIVGGMSCFAGNDAVVKLVARAAPLGEVLFVRGLMTCLLVGTLMIALGHARQLRSAVHPRVLGRSGLEAVAALLFTSALIRMPIAELSTIVLASPLIITALAVILYREEVGWRRWSAIIVGFVGALCVVKPTPAAFNVWALVGLACAFASAGRLADPDRRHRFGRERSQPQAVRHLLLKRVARAAVDHVQRDLHGFARHGR
jgi:hypothetical protein